MIPSFSSYPVFRPPPELAAGSPADWSSAEANRYLMWLVSVLEPRVLDLLAYLGETSEGSPANLLVRVGEKAIWVLKKPEFSCCQADGAVRLTAEGYSLATDLGLLIAKLLIENSANVRWEILRRPKSEVSFNQPVLVGFGKRHLDPVRGSVAEAYRCLKQDGPATAWMRIYEFWSSRGAEVSSRPSST